ncbi:hypothetical protein LSAT2_018197, partial [Lamellibrachia satsuma]
PIAFSSSTLLARTAFLVLVFHVTASKTPNNHPVIFITTIVGGNCYIIIIDISFKHFISKESG